MTKHLEIALAYQRAGLAVLPADLKLKKPTVPTWKEYQQRLPTEDELRKWFANDCAVCLVTGKGSGNLEVIDFDIDPTFYDAWRTIVEAEAPKLLSQLPIERSQSGGRHVFYRAESPVSGNLKLAQRCVIAADAQPISVGKKQFKPRYNPHRQRWEAVATVIETRGEGGILLCDPTPGYELLQGDISQMPIITAEQRELLLSAAYSLNEIVEPVQESQGLSFPDGNRPGDEFNERGDLRPILEKHGWLLVRTVGDQQYWRRPGKSHGWSATIRGSVFFSFTDNAPPFEKDRGYSLFSAYGLLEYGGDFEAAARELARQGYGQREPTDRDVDISHLVCSASEPETPAPPAIPDPGPIPDHLFQLPGFVARVMDFTLATAPYPNVGLAFCGAMALQSFLAGRKVCTRGDLRTNIYLLALASSGTGKEFPRKVNSRILYEIGLAGCLGDKFASGEGIQDALIRCNAMLFQNDEMDGVLRQINLDHENRRESIPNILLTLYTSANDVYPVRVRAGQRESIYIDQPHLTLFGTATPQYFYESLSQRMLTNGFFARMSIIDVGKRGVGQTPGSARNVPECVLKTARWWAEYQQGSGNLQGFHPEPREVHFEPQANEAIEELRKMTEREYDRAERLQDEVGRTAWSRTCEHAIKLALIYACSENHREPVITTLAVEWATAFAMHQTRRQLYLAAIYVAENPFHGECLKLIRKLKEADGQMGRSQLLRAMRCKAADFDQIVGTLTQQGDIMPISIPTKTKTAQGYRIA